MLGAHNDLTQLYESLEVERVLRREINHRVKNSLTLLRALIDLKRTDLHGQVDLSDIDHQVETIRLVHERLQDASSGDRIEFRSYAQRVADGVFASGSGVTVRVDAEPDDISLGAGTAMPVGLIINELATNAAKHAFVDRVKHEFAISLVRSDAGTTSGLTLSVTNTGKPFPEDVNIERPESLGLRLIGALAAQLGASLELDRGTRIRFTFTLPASVAQDVTS